MAAGMATISKNPLPPDKGNRVEGLPAGRGTSPAARWEELGRLLQELERRLRTLIGLSEHRGPGLHQNIPAGELGGFFCDVDIDMVTGRIEGLF